MEFSDLDLNKVYTYADYLKWEFDERVELIKGKIFNMSPAPKRKHQEISVKLERVIYKILDDHPCKVYHAPFDVRFPDRDGQTFTVVQPDICVVCDLSKLDELGCNGAPDFIIEILSSSTSKKDYTDKYQLYEENGVGEYWIVNPEGFIEVFVLEDGHYANQGKFFTDETLASLVLPGLQVDLGKVFKED